MNYIKHLTAVYEKFADDDRLNPSHVSLFRRADKHSESGSGSPTGGHLNANQNKDYGEPL